MDLGEEEVLLRVARCGAMIRIKRSDRVGLKRLGAPRSGFVRVIKVVKKRTWFCRDLKCESSGIRPTKTACFDEAELRVKEDF